MPGVASSEHDDRSSLFSDEKRVLSIGSDRPIRISAGHRLLHHEGKCSRPHGHNYEITVTITGTLRKEGWVIDKGVVTDVIEQWDHRFLLEQGDPLIDAFEQSGDRGAIVVLDHPPTAEVMGVVLEDRLCDQLPASVSEIDVELSETSELQTHPSR